MTLYTLPLLLALAWSGAARAEEVPLQGPVADAPQQDADGVWAWSRRLDGEAVSPEVVAAAAEQVVEAVEAREQVEGADGVDVPDDYYRNPERALTGDPLHLDELDLSEFDIRIDVTPQVEAWMRLLLGSQRKYMHRWLERRSRFEPMISAALKEANLPQDLLYLSMIESGFNPNAYSHADAAGLWQFIPDTGRMYDLRIDYWVDERRDPELATTAALKMLGELHKRFGDWQLAFAAYNTGPGRIGRAVSRLQAEGAPVDYWTMLERGMLHPETAGYVPKILAAAIIGKHPERYGFTDLVPKDVLAYDKATVEGVVDIAVLAKCAGMTEEAFRELNPALRRYTTPDGTTEIRVAPGASASFAEALAALPPAERQQLVEHSVARGESLSAIADRYNVSLAVLVQANHITNPNQITPGQRLVVPIAGRLPDAPVPESSRQAAAAPSTSTPAAAPVARVAAPAPAPVAAASTASRATTYTVRSGDALSEIAERFDLTLSDLQSYNGIKDASQIQAGQVLRLTPRDGSSASGGSAAAAAPAARTYTVRSGDTLSGIAEKYDVSVSDLQSWNGIRNPADLRAGQTLQIRGGSGGSASASASSSSTAASWVTHTVRSGESLGILAAKYHVSIDQIRSWNGIRGNTIYAGDRLKIQVQR